MYSLGVLCLAAIGSQPFGVTVIQSIYSIMLYFASTNSLTLLAFGVTLMYFIYRHHNTHGDDMKRVKRSYTVTVEADAIMDKYAAAMGVSKTAVLEMALREFDAKRKSTVAPVTPDTTT